VCRTVSAVSARPLGPANPNSVKLAASPFQFGRVSSTNSAKAEWRARSQR